MKNLNSALFLCLTAVSFAACSSPTDPTTATCEPVSLPSTASSGLAASISFDSIVIENKNGDFGFMGENFNVHSFYYLAKGATSWVVFPLKSATATSMLSYGNSPALITDPAGNFIMAFDETFAGSKYQLTVRRYVPGIGLSNSIKVSSVESAVTVAGLNSLLSLSADQVQVAYNLFGSGSSSGVQTSTVTFSTEASTFRVPMSNTGGAIDPREPSLVQDDLGQLAFFTQSVARKSGAVWNPTQIFNTQTTQVLGRSLGGGKVEALAINDLEISRSTADSATLIFTTPVKVLSIPLFVNGGLSDQYFWPNAVTSIAPQATDRLVLSSRDGNTFAVIDASVTATTWAQPSVMSDIPSFAAATGTAISAQIKKFQAGADHCGNPMVFGLGDNRFSAQSF